MTSRSEPIQTTNLTLAAYLIGLGRKPRLVRTDQTDRAGNKLAAWVFDGDSDQEGLRELIEEFNAGDALVNPRTFHLQLTNTRRELFDFIMVGREEE